MGTDIRMVQNRLGHGDFSTNQNSTPGMAKPEVGTRRPLNFLRSMEKGKEVA